MCLVLIHFMQEILLKSKTWTNGLHPEGAYSTMALSSDHLEVSFISPTCPRGILCLPVIDPIAKQTCANEMLSSCLVIQTHLVVPYPTMVTTWPAGNGSHGGLKNLRKKQIFHCLVQEMLNLGTPNYNYFLHKKKTFLCSWSTFLVLVVKLQL